MQLTVLADDTHVVEASLFEGQVLIDAGLFAAVTGWEAKPEGLCRGEVCVPYAAADREVVVDDRIDLTVALGAVGRPSVVATDDAVVAIGRPGDARKAVVGDRQAASFTLPDLHGHPHSLADHAGQKKVLHAFASW